MSRVFISHSSADNAKALAIAKWLKSQGWNDFFLDIDEERGIAAGDRWLRAFIGAVDRCEAVLFLLSPAWCRSTYCFAELAQAKAQGKRLFGVLIEAVEWQSVPVPLTSEWQICDLAGPGEAVTVHVERWRNLPATDIAFSRAGLSSLARGLRMVGIAANSFEWPPKNEPNREPYRGLACLEETDAGIYFGREGALVSAMDQIRLMRERGIERSFVILGASGAGKSSFLRAGLLPRLRNDVERFLVLPTIRPEDAAMYGAHGLVNCVCGEMQARGHSTSLADVRDAIEQRGFVALLERLVARDNGTHQTVILPIDQGEELFGAAGRDEAEALFRALAPLGAYDCPTPAIIALTVRSDAWQVAQGSSLLQGLRPNLFSLPSMPQSDYKEVILGPARRHATVRAVTFDHALADQLVSESVGSDALPLLALTLQMLYQQFQSNRTLPLVLGLAEYRRIGKVSGVIGEAVSRAFRRPSERPEIPEDAAKREDALRELFAHLVTVDPHTGEARRLVAARHAIGESGSTLDSLVRRLVEQRLLRLDLRALPDAGTSEEPFQVVEIAHDAVLRQWDILRTWLSEYSERLRALEALERCAHDWARHPDDSSMLVHRGDRLLFAESLVADALLAKRIDGVARSYLSACRTSVDLEQREREKQQRSIAEAQRRTGRVQRALAFVLVGAALLLSAFGAWIVMQSRDVQWQAALGLAAAAARALNDGHDERALRLSVLGVRMSWFGKSHPDAVRSLVDSAAGNRLKLAIPHGKPVASAVFSPDGKLIATRVAGTAHLWDARTGKQIGRDLQHEGEGVAAFSPDGSLLVTTSSSGTVRLWRHDGTMAGDEMRHPKVRPSAVRMSPDGKVLLTAAVDGSVRLWDTTGRPIGDVIQHGGAIESAVFSGDSATVLTASADRTAQLWDAKTGKAKGPPLKHDRGVSAAIFAANEDVVVTASGQIVRAWVRYGEKFVEEGEALHEEPVTSLVLSPDGEYLAAVMTGRARIWRLMVGPYQMADVRHQVVHAGELSSATFGPRALLLTASRDHTARVTDRDGRVDGRPMRHDGPVLAATYSPDGGQVLTASEDGNARVWNIDALPVGAALTHDEQVRHAVFSPDGALVATVSIDGTLGLWQSSSGDRACPSLRADYAPVRDYSASPFAAAFSSDGTRLLTLATYPTSVLNNARRGDSWQLWDSQGCVPIDVEGNKGGKGEARLGERGASFFVVDDNAIWRWDTKSGKRAERVLQLEPETVLVDLSSKVRRGVVVQRERNVRVVDMRSGKPIGGDLVHAERVKTARLSYDGNYVVTVAGTNVSVWDPKRPTAPQIDIAVKETLVYAAMFSPDGRRVLTISGSGAHLWDAKSGDSIAPTGRYVADAAFSPDGHRFVTAGRDGDAQVWDTDSGKELGPVMRHRNNIYSAEFSPDGARVVTASSDRTAQVWDASWASLAHTPHALLRRVCTEFSDPLLRLRATDVGRTYLVSNAEPGRSVCN